MKSSGMFRLTLVAFVMLFWACDDEGSTPIEISVMEATEVTFNSAVLNASVDKIEGDIVRLGFVLTVTGSTNFDTYEISPVTQKDQVSLKIDGLQPGTSFTYNMFADLSNSQQYTSETVTFNTPELPVNEFSISPGIGTTNTPIQITGPFEGFTDPNRVNISFRFDFPSGTTLSSTQNDFVEPISASQVVLLAPQTFVSDQDFDNANADLFLEINGEGYKIGKFQFTSSFYISEETLTVNAGETIDVITNNALSDNQFMINGQTLPASPWLIANGVHRNTITIPSEFTSGFYQVTVVSKSGNPLSLKPDNRDMFTVR